MTPTKKNTSKRTSTPKRCGIPSKGRNELGTVGTLQRTKSLLKAALRVWELKHRIQD